MLFKKKKKSKFMCHIFECSALCVVFHTAECYLSWRRDQHRWWRCSLFPDPAECSSSRSSAPLWTWKGHQSLRQSVIILMVRNLRRMITYHPVKKDTDKLGGHKTLLCILLSFVTMALAKILKVKLSSHCICVCIGLVLPSPCFKRKINI